MFWIVRFIWSVLEIGRTKLYHLEMHTWVGPVKLFLKKKREKSRKTVASVGKGQGDVIQKWPTRRLVGVLATFYFLNWEGLYEYPPYRILLREYNFNFMYFPPCVFHNLECFSQVWFAGGFGNHCHELLQQPNPESPTFPVIWVLWIWKFVTHLSQWH